MLFGFFWQIGNVLGSNWWSVGLWAALQSTATAFALSTSIWYARRLGATPRFAWIVTISVGVLPIYPTLAQTMAKDMVFGWLWVFYALLYTETLRTRGKLLRRPWAMIAFVSLGILIALTKKTGIYLLLASGIVLQIASKSARCRQACALGVVAFLYLVVWTGVLLPAWNIGSGNDEQEMMSIPSQQTALIVRSKAPDLSEQDWGLLNEVYSDPVAMADAYNPLRSDETKRYFRQSLPLSTKMKYFAWMAHCAIRFPDAFFAAPLATCYPLFGIDSWVEFEGKERLGVLFIYEYTGTAPNGNAQIIEQWANWSGGLCTPNDVHALLKGAFRTPEQQQLSDTFDVAYLALADRLPLLFSKALWLTWFPLLVAIYLMRTRNGRGLLAFVPHALVYATLLVGPIVLTRYCTTTLYSLPLILSLLFYPSTGENADRATEGKHTQRSAADSVTRGAAGAKLAYASFEPALGPGEQVKSSSTCTSTPPFAVIGAPIAAKQPSAQAFSSSNCSPSLI